jgi:hypothetical protein
LGENCALANCLIIYSHTGDITELRLSARYANPNPRRYCRNDGTIAWP